MPSEGPPQAACISILTACAPFCCSKKFLSILLAFSVTSNITPPKYFFAHGLSPRDLFDRSRPAENRDAAPKGTIPHETDRHLVAFHNDGGLHLAAAPGQYLLQLLLILIHIDIDGPVPIGCPSLVAEGSGIGAVNDDFVRQTPCH